MKNKRLRKVSLGCLALMFVMGVALAFTGIFGGAFSTPLALAETENSGISLYESAKTYELDGSNATNAANTWNEAVQYSLDNNVQVTVKLTANWTASANNDHVTSFGEGVGFLSGRIDLAQACNIILDLNGKTIDRGLANESAAVAAGGVIRLGHEDAVLTIIDSASGGTITGGNTTTFGGGIMLYYGTLELHDVTFSDNRSNQGGAICVGAGNNSLVMVNCTVSDNTSTGNGGGVYVSTGNTFTMTNCTVKDNSAVNGGGIYITGCELTMSGCTVSGNDVTTNGGGIYCGSKSTFIMTDGVIGGDTDDDANTAANAGGGLFVTSTTGSVSTVEINGGKISHNIAKSAGGGAMYQEYGAIVTLNGGELSDNTSTTTGGGINIASNSSFTMIDGLISNNKSATSGGGVRASNATFTMEGGTISCNTTSMYGGGVSLVNNSKFIFNGGTIGGDTEDDGNYTPGRGGGVYAASSSVMEMSGNAKISHNRCTAEGVSSVSGGNGIWLESANFVMNGGEITYNTSEDAKNAWPIAGGIMVFNSNAEINGGEIAHNVSNKGSGIAIYSGTCSLTINGGKIYDNNNAFQGAALWAWDSNYRIIINGGEIYDNNVTESTNTGAAAWFANPAGFSGYVEMNGGQIHDNKAGGGAGVQLGAYVTFVMNGGEIYDNHANSNGGGVGVGSASATFTMSGGTISGNTATNGAGLYLNFGTFTMSGGTISGNTASQYGGGIDLAGGTDHIMTGGTISGNKAQLGAGVFMVNTFTMSGGTISGNTATSHGGGVYVNETGANFILKGGSINDNTSTTGAVYTYKGKISLSGAPQISGNKNSSGAFGNLYLLSGATVTVVGAFTSGAVIGVTLAADGVFTSGYKTYNTAAPTTYFYSDVSTKAVAWNSGSTEAQIGAGSTNLTKITLTWQYSTDGTNYTTVPSTSSSVTIPYSAQTVTVRAMNGSTAVTISSHEYKDISGSAQSTIKNAGTYSFKVNSTTSTTYYNSTFTLNITPVTVKIGWSASELEYSGSVQNPVATLSGVLGSDNVSLIYNTASAGKDVGTYSVTVTGLTGGNANNYVLENANRSQTYTILPRELGVGGLSVNDKVYDGTTAATINGDTFILYGVCTGDDVTLAMPTLGTLNFDSANAGLRHVVIDLSSLSLSGASAKNYKLASDTLTVSGYISPATVKIDGIVLGENKTYDGTYSAVIDASKATIYIYVDGEYQAISTSALDLEVLAYGSFTDVNAGSGKTVAITSLALDGADSANFIISVADSQATIENLTIAQAKVTITVTAPENWTYGDAKQIGYTVGGAISGENVGVTLTYKQDETTLAGAPSDAGEYSVTAALAKADGNYVIDTAKSTLTVTYTIGAKAITLTAKDVVAVYGATPAGAGYDITSGALLTGDTLSGTAVYKFGTLSGETFTEATEFAVGGAYKVQLSGLENDNYEITFVYGALNITPKSVTVTLTPDSAAEYGKTYTGGAQLVSATLNDVLTGDAAKVNVKLTYYKGTEELTSEPVNAGDYRVVATLAGDAAGNYKLDETVAYFTIAKRALTVTANDGSLEYGAELPANGFGLVYGANQLLTADLDADGVSPKAGVLTYKNGTAPVYNYDYTRYGNIGDGKFEISVSGISSDNYEIKFVSGELTVTAKAVTVQIANQQGVYGDEIALNSVLGTGYKFIKDDSAVTSGVLARETDDLGVVITTDATKASKVGDDYSLIAEWTNKNYSVTFVSADGTAATVANDKATIANAYKITPAALEIKVKDGSVPKGQTIAVEDFDVLNLTVTGLKNSDTAEDLLDGKLTFSISTGSDGNYVVSVTVADLDNYTHNETSGTWTVSTVLVTVIISDNSSVYGEKVLTAADFTAKVTDSYDKELTLDDIGYELKILLPDGVSAIKDAREYVVTAVAKDGTEVGGYKVVIVNGVYTVTPKEITVKAKDQTITFGDDPAKLYADIDENTTAADLAKYIELTSGALVTGDFYTALGVPALTVGGYLINGNADTYKGALVLSGFTGGSGNYKITLENGDLTVDKLSVKVHVDDSSLTSVYGENVNITYTVEDEVSGYALGLKLALGNPVATLADGVVVGTYEIVVDGTYSSNYEISNLDDVLAKTYEITAKAITVTANDVACGYDEIPSGNGYKAEGLVGNDTLTEGSDFAYKFYDEDGNVATSFKANGVYTVKVEGLENANYTISYAEGTLTINGVKVTVTVTVQTNLKYGYTGDIATAEFEGVADGDDVTAEFTYYKNGVALDEAPTEAGDYTVVVTLGGADKDNYTLADNVKSFTIARAKLTVQAVAQSLVYGDDPAKLYDGADFATANELAKYITLVDCTLAGSDDLTVLGTPVFTVSSYSRYGNAATYKGAIILGGLSNANYDIIFVNGDLTVTAREVKIVLTTEDQKTLTSVYGKAQNAITYTVYEKDGITEWTSGAALGATIEVVDYSANANEYAIKVNVDNLNANYTLDSDSVAAVEAYKYKIEKAEITVQPNDIYVTAGSQVSGDATNITVTSGALFDSLADIFEKEGSLTFTFEGYSAQDKKTGTFPIAITVDNSLIANYTVTVASDSEGPVKANLYVAGASTIFLTISDASVLTSVYGDALKTSAELVAKVTASSADVNIADLELVLEIVAADGGEVKNAGAYKVQIKSHKEDLDYTLVLTETPYIITARAITLKVYNAQLTYGDALSELFKDVDFSDSALDLSTYIGLASGSTLAAGDKLDVETFGTPTFKVSGYKQYDDAGTYTQAIVLNGLSNSNYIIAYEYGDLKVNPRSVKVTLDDSSLTSVYGDKVEITYNVFLDGTAITATPDGLVNGDDLGLVISLVNPEYSDAGYLAKGTYSLTAGTSHNTNYDYTWVTALTSKQYTVTAKDVTITAGDSTVTYGDKLYTDSTYGYTVEGFVDGEDESVFTSGALIFKVNNTTLTNSTLLDVDSYTVVPSGYGASQGNYTISYVSGNLTVTPRKVAVTVKTDGEKTYDGKEITLPDDYYDYDETLLVADDELGITLEVVANGANCGMYVVKVKEATNTNYEVTATPGYFKIAEQKVYVQWLGENGSDTDFSWVYNVTPSSVATKQGPTAKFYKDADFTEELTFVNSDGAPVAVTVTGWQVNVGSGYVASVQLPDSVNYVFASGTVNTQEFSITEAVLTVEWKKTTGSAVVGDDEAIEYTYSGAFFNPVPVLKLNGVDVTDNIAFTISGKSQDVGIHTATLELGLNYVIMVDGVAQHSASREFSIVGTALKNFNWQLPSGVYINADDVKNGVEQSFEYTGAALSPSADVVGATVHYTYMYSADGVSYAPCGDPINAGHYKVTAIVEEGYAIPAGMDTVCFEITKIQVDIVWTSTTFTFADGTHQAPVATFVDKLNGNSVVELLVEYSQNGVVITDNKAVAAGEHEGTINVGEYYATVKSLSEIGYDNYEFRVARDVERKYKINADTISIQWGPLYDADGNIVRATNGVYTLTYSETAQGLSWGATKDGYGTQNEQDNLYFVYTVEKDGETYELNDMSEPAEIIREAGTYKISLALKSKSPDLLVSNYALDGAETTVVVNPAKLTITLKADTATAQGVTSVNYGDEVTFRAEYEGFVNGDDEDSLGLVIDGNYWWITSAYTTSANPGSVWTVELTKNTLTQSSFYDKLRNYEVEIVIATFTVNNIDGYVNVIGWNSNVTYFIYDGEAHEPMATYWDATLGRAISLELEVIDGPAVLPGTYHIRVEKPDGIEFANGGGANGDEFEFQIVKRVLVVQIPSQSTDFGNVNSDNAESSIIWQYGIYDEYNVRLEPIAADLDGLNLEIYCTFEFDENNFANANEYAINFSWNSADYSDLYDIIFVDENNNEIVGGNTVKFTINKAQILVTSRGEQFYDQEVTLSAEGVTIGLGDLEEDGTYKYIVFSGSNDISDASITFEYRIYDLSNAQHAAELEDENYVAEYTVNTISINKAGSFAVRYKIEKPNHETLEGIWRVLVLKEEDAIIVLFQNRFRVEYGEGVPEDFMDQIFGVNEDGEEYFTLKGAVTDKDTFRDMVERAYVYNVNQASKVGYYTIYFDLKEGIGTSTHNYEIMYREPGNSVESNRNSYVITQKVLTVDWGLSTDTFTFDDAMHMPSPVITGWLNGGSCSLASLADGQRYFYTDSNNERIIITVSIDGDFTSIGEHEVRLTVDNLNYRLNEQYRDIKILGGPIAPVDPVEPGVSSLLPSWAMYAIIAAAVLLLLIMIILIVALKKRKPAEAASDSDGFYDNADADEEGLEDLFNDIFNEEE